MFGPNRKPPVLNPHKISEIALSISICILFLFLGWNFITEMGIEVDEAVCGAWLDHVPAVFLVDIGQFSVPLMILNYVGALKLWLLSPILTLGGPKALCLRFPTLLLGLCTILLSWLFMKEVANKRAAWITALLMASDTSFLALTTIDFGPVSIQLALKMTVALCLVSWYRTRRVILLIVGFFCVGLAMWDKALFSWIAAGMCIGLAVAAPKELRGFFRLKPLFLAIGSFCLGSLPLLVFNVYHPLETFRANARFSTQAALEKIPALVGTIDGSLLLGFFTAADPAPRAGVVPAFLAAAVDSGIIPTHNWISWACLAAAAMVPFLGPIKARLVLLFLFVAFMSGWALMAITVGAGGGAHHVLLLWPMHIMFIAIVLSEVSHRLPLAVPMVVIASLVSINCLVTAKYVFELKSNGPGIRWTKASNELAIYLKHLHASKIYVADWGILETADFLTEGSLPLASADAFLISTTDPDRQRSLRELALQPGTFFVTHVPKYEQIPGRRQLLDDFASRTKIVLEVRAETRDRFYRPIFLVLSASTK